MKRFLNILTVGLICSCMFSETPPAHLDTRPCYTDPSELGKVVADLTKRVGLLENKVNKLQILLNEQKKQVGWYDNPSHILAAPAQTGLIDSLMNQDKNKDKK